MKKIIFLLIFLNVLYGYSQKYAFNTIVKYQTVCDRCGTVTENLLYVHTKNDAYYMKLYKTKDEFTARLYDFKNRVTHRFNVVEINAGGGITFRFDYESTWAMEHHKNNYDGYIFDFATLSENDSIKKINLKIYQNKKRKKVLRNIDMETAKYSENLFPAFRISFIHPYEYADKLNIFENMIVIKGSQTIADCDIATTGLTDFQKIAVEIAVPENHKVLRTNLTKQKI